jgi:hypothetical protein
MGMNTDIKYQYDLRLVINMGMNTDIKYQYDLRLVINMGMNTDIKLPVWPKSGPSLIPVGYQLVRDLR